jgi:flavin-dependent dehydrogenase
VSQRTELLVVGGGPAGSALAAMSAAAGIETLVVERARFPRDKVCGEFLSAEGCRVLERLGLLERLVEAGARWIDRCRITHPSGPLLDQPLPELGRLGREALGVSRRLLDSELLKLAAACGARVLQPWEAKRPIFTEDRVRGMVLREVGTERTETVRAMLVVAADGRRSLLARLLHPQLGDPRRSDARSWFGFSVHLDPGDRTPPPRIDLHLFDGGYAGLGPVERGRLDLGLIATVGALRACGRSPQRLYDERLLANAYLREAIGKARIAGPWNSIGPLRFGARRATAGGVLFVGDAAGTVDPFCGEGMANALCGAELALPFVREGVSAGGLSDALAHEYATAWSGSFDAVTRRVRRLGRLLERPRLARAVLRLLSAAGTPLASRLIASTRTGRAC